MTAEDIKNLIVILTMIFLILLITFDNIGGSEE